MADARMKDIELLLPRVLEKAAACPEPTAIRHLRDAAIEFCRRTRIWRESDSFDLTDETCESLTPFTDAQIYEISHAAYVSDPGTDDERGDPLEAVTIDWLDKEQPGWRTLEGTPRWITQSAPNTVRIAPRPEAGGRLQLELILLPASTADQLPDVLIDTYSREIADGALGSVLLLPVEFGNAELGAMHKGLFEGHLGRFADRIPRGQQRTRRRTKPGSYF